jgi:hypothetical protein
MILLLPPLNSGWNGGFCDRSSQQARELFGWAAAWVTTEPRSAFFSNNSQQINQLEWCRMPRVCRDLSGGVSKARKSGQILGRGPRTWLVRVYNGRDPETKERKFLNKTIIGGLLRRRCPQRREKGTISGGFGGANGSQRQRREVPIGGDAVQTLCQLLLSGNRQCSGLQRIFAAVWFGELACHPLLSPDPFVRHASGIERKVVPLFEYRSILSSAALHQRHWCGMAMRPRHASALFCLVFGQPPPSQAEGQLRSQKSSVPPGCILVH